MRARVFVTLKRDVLDPQGAAVQRALESMGMQGVKDVRIGKVVDLELDGAESELAPRLDEVARKLLSNGVIEDYRVTFPDAADR